MERLLTAANRLLAVLQRYDIVAKIKREWLLGGSRELELFESAVDKLDAAVEIAEKTP